MFLDFLLFTFFTSLLFTFSYNILDMVNDAATSLYCNAVVECIYIFKLVFLVLVVLIYAHFPPQIACASQQSNWPTTPVRAILCQIFLGHFSQS